MDRPPATRQQSVASSDQQDARHVDRAQCTPLVGIGYRHEIGDWIFANLDRFDVLEVTLDHYLYGGPAVRAALERLARTIPIVAHGIGLSIGTDAPLDLPYVREIARVVSLLRARSYSEHIAFTKVPGLDLGNLLPLPKTAEVADRLIEKIGAVRTFVPVPVEFENISYCFDWPDSVMTDAEFLGAICRGSGAGLLLDVENLHVNAHNHDFDAFACLDELPVDRVRGLHMAGGQCVGAVLVDSHDEPVPDMTFELLDYALGRFAPATIVLERDERLDAVEEILADVDRIRAHLRAHPVPVPRRTTRPLRSHAEGVAVPPIPLIERQRALIGVLSNPLAALPTPLCPEPHPALRGLPSDRLKLARDSSVGKRLAKIRSALPRTIAWLGAPIEVLAAEFAAGYPPFDIGRYENTRQFCEFLAQIWEQEPPKPPFVLDLARVELALARSRRSIVDDAEHGSHEAAGPSIRRHPAAQLLRCRYDVRPLFDPTVDDDEPEARDVCLAVLPPDARRAPADGMPRVLEIPAQLCDWLEPLAHWRSADGGETLRPDPPADVLDRLLDLGLIESRP